MILSINTNRMDVLADSVNHSKLITHRAKTNARADAGVKFLIQQFSQIVSAIQ